MPFDLNTAIENIQLALQRLPSALIAIALLGAPTVAWILYRALEVRRAGLAKEEAPPEYWACGECGSLSRVGQEWCYRCGAALETELDESGADVGVPVMAVGHGKNGTWVPVMPEATAVPVTPEHADPPRPVVIRAAAKTVHGPGRASTRRD